MADSCDSCKGAVVQLYSVDDAPFLPEDRIGALELQNISVTDNRDLLVHHLSSVPRLRGATDEFGGLLTPSKQNK